MQHEQQDSLTRSSLPLLLPLLALSLAVPWLIEYYESQQDYQWEDMLRQQWQPAVEPISMPVTAPALASADTPEWQSLQPVPSAAPEPPLLEEPREEPPPPLPTPALPPEPAQARQPQQAVARPPAVAQQVSPPKPQAKPAARPLKLKLPENPYRGEVAQWEEEPPLPDLFAPKPAPPSRLELGGRLITDDEVQKKNPDADFIDTVKGAEINITVKMN